MDLDKLIEYSEKLNPKVLQILLKIAKSIPSIRRKMDEIAKKEQDSIIKVLEPSVKPYIGEYPSTTHIPLDGINKNSILKEMKNFSKIEMKKWKNGYVSGAVYHGDEEHINFLNKIYAINSQSNPLHSDVWPSTMKYEAEIISMTANMLGSDNVDSSTGDGVCGSISSGGTESILLAMKTYRDWAREKKGIKRPEMIAPVTVHPAFDKASKYFKIKMKKIPVDSEFRADVNEAKKAVTRNTIVIVGSAPSFPHGIIDPIEELSEIARKKGIGFHTDACLGGFILPWAKKLGYNVPQFDFRLPGVTSMSADTHKFGYAPKGTSVVMYRTHELRHYQYYKVADWPGGLYFSPTFAGSRPGALSAACWSALVSIGEKGYLDAAKKILKTADKIKKGIKNIPELTLFGNPLFDIAFSSNEHNIYRIMEYMSEKGWSLNGLHKPPAVHICVTLRHSQKGVADRFIRDLKAGIKFVKANPDDKGKIAPVYGLAATVPDTTVVADLLDVYMDLLYKT